MTDSKKRNRQAGAMAVPGDTGQHSSPDGRQDRRELQGIGTKRHANQRAPRWTPPKGAAALTELESLFTPPAQWVVSIRKASTGAVVVFSSATCKADAESTCARLRSFGLDARVELVRDGMPPGSTVRTR